MSKTTEFYLPQMVMQKLMAEVPNLEPNWVAFRVCSPIVLPPPLEGLPAFPTPREVAIYPDNLYTAALFFGILLPKPIEADKQLLLTPFGHPDQFLWFRSYLDYGHSHKQKAFFVITITDENI